LASAARPSPLRRFFGVLAALLVACFTATAMGTALATPASAADGYRYWNYFHLTDGSWEFSQVGPGDYEPQDGDVEAYRFGTSTTNAGLPPRADLDQVGFDSVCAGEDAGPHRIRVAVLVDYGTEADAEGTTPPAPRSACAVVGDSATGQQVLDAVAEVRSEKGLTCALDGYPVKGCGEAVAGAPTVKDEPTVAFELPGSGDGSADEATEDRGSLLWPLVGAGGLVVLIGGGGLALARRNKAA
jgi:hypothetical protein